MESKESFSSKLGFVLAAAGSAVGLGNIWRFPYLAARYGGGVFLVTYLVLALTFGYTLMISENCIGRMTGKGPVGAFRDICKNKRSFLRHVRLGGWLNALASLIILPYYCVIGGWVTKYVAVFLCNSSKVFSKDNMAVAGGKTVTFSEKYFTDFITGTWEPMIFFLVFVLIMVFVVALGVEKGIERFNEVLMPALIVLAVAICIYCCFLPNAKSGFRYYLMPDWSKFSYMTLVAALGQLFYSLSLAMGIAITYGSYMRKDDDLVSNVNQVELFDTAVAFLAGMMIIPAAVAFGGESAAASRGPSLVFVTMPQVFANFPGGRVVGIMFFIMVLFAAATSAISMLETNVQSIGQELKLSRKASISIGLLEILVVGIITILGYSVLSFVHPLKFIGRYANMDILDSLDFISNNILLPLGGISTTVLVTCVIGLERFCQEVRRTSSWHREYVFQFCMCLVVIPCLLLILLDSLGIFH